jgi:hypothetical protein
LQDALHHTWLRVDGWERSQHAVVISGLSTSVDGFIAGANDSPEQPLGVGGEGCVQESADQRAVLR